MLDTSDACLEELEVALVFRAAELDILQSIIVGILQVEPEIQLRAGQLP